MSLFYHDFRKYGTVYFMDNTQNRNTFSSSFGFVLAAAGSAVGLGNIWRFPYLAAKDGGGLFLVIYLILAVTFGFALVTTEVAIGRKTKQSPLTAYKNLHAKWGWLGKIACIIPMMIMPYYCVIGGWVLKYAVAFVTGQGASAAADSYFSGFITSSVSPIVYTFIFLFISCYIIYRGVKKGIEALSKILMPILVVLIIGISIFALTMSHTDDSGSVRTGLQGLKIFVIPDFTGLTLNSFMITLMDAMGQLFYSLSVAMGIMIAYGSYVRDESNLVKSINRIEIFDTAVAILAGLMIIPTVFVFMGREGVNASGPGLMFVAMPKIFAQMGIVGTFVGALFFIMVFFAAITSSISILEAVVSSFMDEFKISRRRAVVYEGGFALLLGILVCLGYNALYFEVKLPNGVTAQILDIMDYISNNILMPIVSIGTCLLIGWILKPKTVIEEACKNGENFIRHNLYVFMVKFAAPFLLVILFLKSLGILNF